MVLRNLLGERVVPVQPNYCVFRTSNSNSLLDGGRKRPRDIDVAADATAALWRGQSVQVGSNIGKLGEGTAIRYRGRSDYNHPNDYVQVIDKFVASGGQFRTQDDMNRTLAIFATPQQTYEDLLRELRDPMFRVIVFADPWVKMDKSQLYSYAIEYTVPVAARLTAQVVPEDRVCNLATHARRGYAPGTNIRFTPI